ncbi:MAG: hypothetical protein OXI73_04115 [Rhodospirillales bacterium]|nr:hypothetical protein [Rhodospirillales bacterium]
MPGDDVQLMVDLQQLTLAVQPILFECESRGGEIVQLFRELGFARNDLELQCAVFHPHQRLAGFDDGAFLDENVRDLAAFDGVQVDRRARDYVACDRDVFVKCLVVNGRYRQ